MSVYFFQYTADAVVVPESSPFKTFQDLVKAAKAQPEKVSLAGSGTKQVSDMMYARRPSSPRSRRLILRTRRPPAF